jgi:hypothetical protein
MSSSSTSIPADDDDTNNILTPTTASTTTTTTIDEVELTYKKALKTWEGEKRAAIKKVKTLKGKKKSKDVALAAVESEYDIKLQTLQKE